MTLKDWATKYSLKEEKTSPQEIAELLKLADQKLDDCRILSGAGVSMDHYHSSVYEASLPCATAALRAEGYRVPTASDGGHSLLFQALTFTVDKKSKYLNVLQEARKTRNQTTYSFVGSHKKTDIDSLFATIRELRTDVEKWIRKEHSDLILAEPTANS